MDNILIYLTAVVDMVWDVMQAEILPGVSIYLVLFYTMMGSIVWTVFLRRY